jgi:16S rRNA (cytosine1402-N4)-methyltransferase
MNDYHHIPVLLQEVLTFLDPKPGQLFVDATLGGGGYTKAVLERTAPSGKVLAIDLDTDAIENFREQNAGLVDRTVLVHGNFSAVAEVVAKKKFGPVSGIVADIGLSSYELETAGRGISFQKDEPLDMRFDTSSSRPTAAFMLAEYSEKELADIFENFGEEKFAKVIARNIVRNRSTKPLTRTGDLTAAISASIPARLQHKATDSFRRVFQALRIAVNAELENLEKFLPEAFSVLAPGGVLVVVSFHSLEDRMVKQFFASAARGCVCPKDFPTCVCGRTPAAKILTKKPLTASAPEVSQNPRSKPAKLRALLKY